MKQFWLRPDECTACGACVNICPHNAIDLKADECGFLYPEITDWCTECNACQRICEKRLDRINNNCDKPVTYAAWSKNEDVRFKSTSGGAFTELSRVILSRGGYVVGAQYNVDNLVEHVMISDEEGLEKIRQSKYIQSDIGLVYRQIKNALKDGKEVAFCGAPCQVAGLYAYLGKSYDNLVTFDFICRGMNSPKAYKSWLNEIEDENNSKIVNVWFKYKQGGWKKSPRCTRIDFENGKHVVLDQGDNLFMSGYLSSNLYIRPSCGDCKFKGVPRQGDITLADFWGLDKKLDDDKGTSMILVNSPKGQKLFEQVNETLVLHKREFEEIFEGNVCFTDSVEVPANGKKFLRSLDKYKFSVALKKYTKRTLFEKVSGKVKRIMRHI